MVGWLVPELYVSDFAQSLAFYTTILGFRIAYARYDENFAYLERGAAALMIEEPIGRTWLTAPLEQPYGRGINLQIAVDCIDVLFGEAQAAGLTFLQSIETRDYQRAVDFVTLRQFVVADPDGYLLRFSEVVKIRPMPPTQ